MSVSVCCLGTEPWGDSQLRTISLFDIISLNSETQAIKESVLWVVAAKAKGLDGYTSSFLEDTGDQG